jgi:flagellar motor protein MotB
MSKLFTSILFSFFLLFQTTSIADEGDVERLVVPEAQDSTANADKGEEAGIEESLPEEPETSAETPQISNEENEVPTHTLDNEDSPQETQVEEQSEETQEASTEVTEEVAQTEEKPSEEELEAKHAEEAELREVGAGEEPIVD